MGEGQPLVFQAKGIYHYLKNLKKKKINFLEHLLDLVMLIGTNFGGNSHASGSASVLQVAGAPSALFCSQGEQWAKPNITMDMHRNSVCFS